MSLFTLRGNLSKVQSLILGLVGLLIFLGLWWLMAEWFAIDKSELSENPRLEETETDFVLSALEDLDPLDNKLPEDAQTGTYTGLRIHAPGYDSTSIALRLADDAGGLFSIHPKTGEVRLAEGPLNYEESTVYTIVASADASDGRKFSSNFTIQVQDRNEFWIGPLEDADSQVNEVSVLAGVEEYTGLQAFAEDRDGTDKVSYRLLNHAKGLFAIDRESGRVVVQDTAKLRQQGLGAVPLTIVANSTDFSADTANFYVQLIQSNQSVT